MHYLPKRTKNLVEMQIRQKKSREKKNLMVMDEMGKIQLQGC